MNILINNNNINNNNNDHTPYSQELQEEVQLCNCVSNDNNVGTNKHNKHNLSSDRQTAHHVSHEQAQQNEMGEQPGQDAAAVRHPCRKDPTLDNSEQIFFYDNNGQLMHARLYSDTDPDQDVRDRRADHDCSHEQGKIDLALLGTASVTTCTREPRLVTSNDPHRNHSGDAAGKERTSHRSKSPRESASRSRSRSLSRSGLHTPRSASSSYSQSKSRPRSASDAWSRTMSESLIGKDLVIPLSFSKSSTRPSILPRGFSADPHDQDQHPCSTGGGGVSHNSGRKATAKERLVAMVTRGTGSSTPPPGSKDAAAKESSDRSPQKGPATGVDDKPNPRPGRSSLLTMTYGRRQGPPSLNRAALQESSGMNSPPEDDAMGFPYNNSSLLASNTKASSNLRTTRKPRPFSVATMEKVFAQSGKGHNSIEQRQDVSPIEKGTSQERLMNAAQPSHGRHQPPVHSDRKESSEHVGAKARVAESGFHPLLSSPESPTHPMDGLQRRGSKGKEIERMLDSGSTVKVGSSPTYPQSTLGDMTSTSTSGPVHVHEHHIHHHHYYCQHCPPLIQSNTDGMVPMEQHFNSIVNRLRPESVPVLTNVVDAHPSRPSVMESEFSISPTELGQFAPGHENLNTSVKPLVNKKKKSILGTMTMTSSVRKRFFSDQKREQQQQQQQQQQQLQQQHQQHQLHVQSLIQGGHLTLRRRSSPISSLHYSGYDEMDPTGVFYRKNGPYDPAGATIRAKHYQRRIPLEGLSDDEDEDFDYFDGSYRLQSPVDSSSNSINSHQAQHQQQQREKFLSRLKRFLLRPSPFVKSPDAQNSSSLPNSMPTTPTHLPVAATVRLSKGRWSRGGRALVGPQGQDMDMDSGRQSPAEGHALFSYYPSRPQQQQQQQQQQRASTVRRWTHQDMMEPFVPTLQRRDRIDIRTQFQQSSPAASQEPPEQPTHHFTHHHHHHHEMTAQDPHSHSHPHSHRHHNRSHSQNYTHHRHHSYSSPVPKQPMHQRKQSLTSSLEKRPPPTSTSPSSSSSPENTPTTTTTITSNAGHRSITATTATIMTDVRSAVDSQHSHRSPKSMVTSVVSSIPITSSTSLEEEEENGTEGGHDTSMTRSTLPLPPAILTQDTAPSSLSKP
ncbi:MAG: hypothetical protein J3Q66DRAFT_326707 [Benniella sp.]|nr:MAG: hypothetical protein J3Q66DRAFT_326707 [Benniella sp.]